MRNMLRETLSGDEFRRIFRDHPPVPLLPPETDPTWQAAASRPALASLLQNLRRLATDEIDQSLPILTDDLYSLYGRTGNRLQFENLYFERRRRLARAAIATLVEADPRQRARFRNSLHRKAAEIFHEPSWALPAHVKNPTGKDPLSTDLFAAETANLFGELLTLFPDTLPDGFAQGVRQRLRSEFFENYLAQDPWWLTGTNNWNAVCHQGVLGAALAVEEDADLLAKMFVKAAQNLPHFLAGYSADGATAEGPGYWSYGFGWFAELNAQLEKRTGNTLSIFEGDPLIPLIARFGPAMALRGGNLVNFSDAAPTGGLRPSLLEYLADRLHDPGLAVAAQNFWHGLGHDPDNLHGERADLFLLSRLLLRCPGQPAALTPLPLQDTYLPGVAWMVVRSRDRNGHEWEFAAKAGHNAEHHNHNDIGSYLLHIDGERLLLEIGAPEYVKDFFNNKTRYGFLAARSLGHSVPLINGIEQADGEQYKSVVTEHHFSPDRAVFTLDLTNAYPAEGGLLRGVRRFVLDKKAGRLHVSDECELAAPSALETAIITPEGTRIEGERALVRAGAITLRVTPDAGCEIREFQRHDYNTHDGTPAVITRIVLVPRRLENKTRIGYSVEIVAPRVPIIAEES